MDLIGIDGLTQISSQHFLLLETLQKENEDLKFQVGHLKELLTSTAPLIGGDVSIIEVPQEQAICEIQLRMLNEKAHGRELTLEETKRLEILVKSLYLIKERQGSAIPTEFANIPKHLSLEDLGSIASTNE
jgi:hypothetical protein